MVTSTLNWQNFFSNIPPLINNRDESRKVNDHYEKKLEQLYREKETKIKKNSFSEGSSFGKQLERVTILYNLSRTRRNIWKQSKII